MDKKTKRNLNEWMILFIFIHIAKLLFSVGSFITSFSQLSAERNSFVMQNLSQVPVMLLATDSDAVMAYLGGRYNILFGIQTAITFLLILLTAILTIKIFQIIRLRPHGGAAKIIRLMLFLFIIECLCVLIAYFVFFLMGASINIFDIFSTLIRLTPLGLHFFIWRLYFKKSAWVDFYFEYVEPEETDATEMEVEKIPSPEPLGEQ